MKLPIINEKGNFIVKRTQNKNAEIVFYCRSDRMSTIASETLVGLGYTNIYNLDGGMVAWETPGWI